MISINFQNLNLPIFFSTWYSRDLYTSLYICPWLITASLIDPLITFFGGGGGKIKQTLKIAGQKTETLIPPLSGLRRYFFLYVHGAGEGGGEWGQTEVSNNISGDVKFICFLYFSKIKKYLSCNSNFENSHPLSLQRRMPSSTRVPNLLTPPPPHTYSQ